MSVTTPKNLLRKLLLRNQSKYRLWAAMIALCVGTTLLLFSVMILCDFRELLFGKAQQDSLGSTYLVIGKKVTQENMATPNATIFSADNLEGLRSAPQVQDVGQITASRFPVYAVMGGKTGFATELPLESAPDNFIDNKPPNWRWAPGERDLPIIISSQFLDIYNYVFAPGQGLPQLSEASVKSIALNLKAGEGDRSQLFTAHVVGFSDRIGSVLAPQSFIDYGNRTFGGQMAAGGPSQVILKVHDPSDTRFATYIKQHEYTTNTENLRWSKIRAIVEVVSSATGVLALLLMGIGSLVFILFIELTIAKAQASLSLLLELGYSPRYLSRFMVSRFLPMALATVLVALIVTLAAQYSAASVAMSQGLNLPILPGWPVWAAATLCTVLLATLIIASIRRAIKKQ